MKRKARLSQCMIVKNEEKNIEQALSWGKGIVCEQIVVDTGSTDQTVEIAERMGAKVFHFEWIHDFSAAKNYAIEQASGDWIAFLDADEYFLKEDAIKLKKILDQFSEPRFAGHKPDIIRCAWLHLDDKGHIFANDVQDRIFRNMAVLRYKNPIHEVLSLDQPRMMTSYHTNLSIFHTGYTQSAYRETQKIQRNIDLLKKELEKEPENFNAMVYLGDCYMLQEEYQQALEFYQTAVEIYEKKSGAETIVRNPYKQILVILARFTNADENTVQYWYEKSVKNVPDHPDTEYYYGEWLAIHEQWESALKHLEKAMENLERYTGTKGEYLSGNLDRAYFVMASTAQQLGNLEKMVQYMILSLRCNRYQENVLCVLINLLKQEKNEVREIVELLSKIYKTEQLKDKLFLLKCAKITGNPEIEQWINSLLTEEDQTFLNKA